MVATGAGGVRSDHNRSVSVATHASLFMGGMVVEFGNAGSGYRNRPDFLARSSGPLQLFAANRIVCRIGVARGGLAGQRRGRQIAMGSTAALSLCIFSVVAWKQVSWWRNSETLWSHTLECTRDNFIAQCDFGTVLLEQNRAKEAIAHYRQALQINPKSLEAHYNLGDALIHEGKTAEAIAEYNQVLQLNPSYAQA